MVHFLIMIIILINMTADDWSCHIWSCLLLVHKACKNDAQPHFGRKRAYYNVFGSSSFGRRGLAVGCVKHTWRLRSIKRTIPMHGFSENAFQKMRLRFPWRAHPSLFRVLVGSLLISKNASDDGVTYNVEKYIVHESFYHKYNETKILYGTQQVCRLDRA